MSAELKPLANRDGEPLFAEPWQAQVTALAAQLVESGRLGADQWAEALGNQIRLAQQAEESDSNETYYACVLRALEMVLQSENLLSQDDLTARKSQWIRAYETTPHGQPVTLKAGKKDL
ncbi:MAG: nitrile hydratase accessory protein [Pseudomonadota bacterium]